MSEQAGHVVKMLIAGVSLAILSILFLTPAPASAHGIEHHVPAGDTASIDGDTAQVDTCCHHDGTCTPKPIVDTVTFASRAASPEAVHIALDDPHPYSRPASTDPPPPRL